MSRTVLTLLLLLSLPTEVLADATLRERGTVTPGSSILAVEAIGGTSVGGEEGADHRRTGLALLYEQPLVPRWLHGEISLGTTVSEEGTFIPVELLLKVPFRVTAHWELFVGAGPAMMVDFAHQKTRFGGVGSVGMFYWLGKKVGLVLEVDYLLLRDNGAAQQVEGALGLAWRLG